jgi:hypothetical protein
MASRDAGTRGRGSDRRSNQISQSRSASPTRLSDVGAGTRSASCTVGGFIDRVGQNEGRNQHPARSRRTRVRVWELASGLVFCGVGPVTPRTPGDG